MPAQILDGRKVAQRMRERLREARDSMGSKPVRLVSLEIGQNPAAAVYVRNQQRAAADVGIDMEVVNLPLETDEARLLAEIEALNDRDDVSGMLVQRPLPHGIDPRNVQTAIAPGKDVEGMHPANMGAILYKEPLLPPCTAAAAQQLQPLYALCVELADVREAREGDEQPALDHLQACWFPGAAF